MRERVKKGLPPKRTDGHGLEAGQSGGEFASKVGITKNPQATTTTVSQVESRYSSPQPYVAFSEGAALKKTALHKFAAETELATPAGETWCVQVDDYNQSWRVYLGLADATPAEAARGMAMFKRLAG